MLFYTVNGQADTMEVDSNNGFDILIKECDDLIAKIVRFHAGNGILFVKPFEEVLMEFLEEEDENTMIFILNWMKILLVNFKGDLFTKFYELINRFVNLITISNEIVSRINSYINFRYLT